MSRLPPAAMFLVRVWHEDGHFRARVIQCLDLHLELPTEILTADPNDLIDQLRTWLHDVEQSPDADARSREGR